jgi:hypothetical protein
LKLRSFFVSHKPPVSPWFKISGKMAMKHILFVCLFSLLYFFGLANCYSQDQRLHTIKHSEILHVDVQGAEIKSITDYINKHFDAHIFLDPDIADKRITTRCETSWFNALLQICAENELVVAKTPQGIWLKKKQNR